MMNKTTKQIADDLGISKQKVYRYIKKHHIKEAHQKHIDRNNVKHYDEMAQNQIKQAFADDEANQKPHQEAHQDYINDILLKQLEIKDKQIEELQKALDQEQQLHALDKSRLIALEDKQTTTKPPKKSWWSWLRKDGADNE